MLETRFRSSIQNITEEQHPGCNKLPFPLRKKRADSEWGTEKGNHKKNLYIIMISLFLLNQLLRKTDHSIEANTHAHT